jgi:hypothetical protein
LQKHTQNLEDLMMDVPLSPQILAAVIPAGAMPFSVLEGLVEKVESCAPKRCLVEHLMPYLAEELGKDGAVQMVKGSGVNMGVLLDADASFEPGVQSVFDFVKFQGLDWMPL